jgi:methionyl-tRNA formyltransferase
MRIVFFGNNWVAWQVAQQLKAYGENTVGLVLHPPGRRKFGREIEETFNLEPSAVFDASTLRDPGLRNAIAALRPDLGLSVFFGYVFQPEFIAVFPSGIINVHPAFLPYNRGAYPNVWSIVDGTPAGATIHYVDAGIDTGRIIGQKEVSVEPTDTGETLYWKLARACVELFAEAWPLIRSNRVPSIVQPEGGTSHRLADVAAIDEIDLDATYQARRLIDVIRARTFPPFPGAYFKVGERRVYLQLKLVWEEDLSRDHDRGAKEPLS